MSDEPSFVSSREFQADRTTWDDLISHLPGAHILQSWEWGEFKNNYGWMPERLIWENSSGEPQAAAQILLRTMRLGGIGPLLRVAYVPRGPLLDWRDASLRTRVLDDLEQFARSRRVIFIKVDPEVFLGKGYGNEPDADADPSSLPVVDTLKARGWLYSEEQIQFRNTVWLDLQGGEGEWLARMKQKTRYNLRLAERKGVTIRAGKIDDIPLLYRLYAETSLRDGFVIRPEEYYRRVWGDFHGAQMAHFLIAEVGQEAVAALILFTFAERAWYLYGMSRDAHRDKMPNYLLQWEAMRLAKARGCRTYDLWGAPDEPSPQDPLWGVYRFKEGLGGQVVRTAGAWDYPVKKSLYPVYTRLLPKILNILRQRGVERTRREVTL